LLVSRVGAGGGPQEAPGDPPFFFLPPLPPPKLNFFSPPPPPRRPNIRDLYAGGRAHAHAPVQYNVTALVTA